ncbi:sigma-70 region 4 domain-containing protein [Simonsiella muelleri]|uniref:RNA polymerase sigma factor 70 region 4 type 2 domain-containing protein n=1 Tax=Simonsiella muelleri ATCC 29453 TaxID=641147 RepID=V9HMQ2_9NEIS|nr:sigma-70 region 4 domain-containing protein [Simonsiella muelleri]AUX61991.1 hypothetical protein BWP33_09425 [Simonsiella muelleri ATCC 29453]EFG31502.1 hypothetical protein HMPREF9021_00772 [Simonsiella muelleri ATCC 29453]UBQ54091.1 sigma-70 region 4 domain-containing protein [Simonsiella muelleri]
MTIDDLLKMWADWLRLPCTESSVSLGKHPLAKLIDGNVGGRPVYCSTILYGGAVDNSVAAKVEMAIAKLSSKYQEIVRVEYLRQAEQEIKAQYFGISVNNYRVRLHRAKMNLSLLLKDLLK